MVQTLKRDLTFIRDFAYSWFVVGGWALDLYLGHQTREHHDLDVGIFRVSQLTLQRLLLQQGWDLEWLENGLGHPWKEGEYLALPVHEIWGFRSSPNIEIVLNECDETNWLYRRDTHVSLPFEKAIFQYDTIPYLAPEAVLLFKSKNIRKIDNLDFEKVLPHLSQERRKWLKNALVLQDSQHPWLGSLC